MRIHRLVFAAIGPFAGEHRIDFDDLDGSSLFLIDGPTGAGKSTIIDAIVFALYGDVAGRGSDRQRLRSGFAAPDVESFVELDFSTTAGRFLVRRTPDYERRKLRGQGLTPVASTVHASRSIGDQGWEPVSGRKGEADAEIQRWVGLTRPQFLQTVVLPQGEFANFLAAESRDRLVVLERIFATEVYSRVEKSLEDQRHAADGLREAAAKQVRDAARDVYARLPDDDEERPEAGEIEDLDADALQARLVGLEAAVAARVAAHAAGSEEQSALLLAVQERLDAVRRRLSATERVRQADTRLAVARAADATARRSVADREAVVAAIGADLADLPAALSAVDRALGRLEQAASLEARLVRDAVEAGRLQKSIDDADAELARIAVEREQDLPRELLALSAALARCIESAHEASDEAADREREVVQARLDGMAAELATALVDGEPCAVCGAVEHPQPAQQSGRPVTARDLEVAASARAAALDAAHELVSQRARLRAVGDVGVDEAASADGPVDLAPEQVAGAITGFQERVASLQRRAADRAVTRAAAESTLLALTVEMADRRDRVHAALAGHATVADRVAELSGLRAELDQAIAAAAEASAAALALAEAQRELDAVVDARPDALDEAAAEAVEARLDTERAALAVAAQAAATRWTESAALLVDLRARIVAVVRARAQRDEVHASTADVIALANLVRGGEGNALAQPLSAYVVQTMFDEVLDVANQRLSSMLDGRFELRSTEARTTRIRTGLGLGLEVRDLRTESNRKTSTLSGGETFCASLALALGLADIVRAHAGGVDIGMLFIDEGFGSLDADRLDDVMAELGRLQAGGRTVGVISHVTEMKRTINERIDVRPGGEAGGSTLSVSWSD